MQESREIFEVGSGTECYLFCNKTLVYPKNIAQEQHNKIIAKAVSEVCQDEGYIPNHDGFLKISNTDFFTRLDANTPVYRRDTKGNVVPAEFKAKDVPECKYFPLFFNKDDALRKIESKSWNKDDFFTSDHYRKNNRRSNFVLFCFVFHFS